MPEQKQLMNLEKVIAFNPAYRAGWRDYLLTRSSNELACLLDRLTAGLDSESAQLCEAQIDLMRRFAPHPLLRQLYLDEQVKRDLLPKETRLQLRGFGQFDVDGKSLSEIKQKLSLPEEPLPELLAHSGLLYIRDVARDALKESVIIDAGAYIGDTAKLFASYYSPKKIYALEPDQANYERMCALIDEWGLAGRIIPRQLATSDRAGQIDLWGQGMGTSVIQKAEMPGSRVDHDRRIDGSRRRDRAGRLHKARCRRSRICNHQRRGCYDREASTHSYSFTISYPDRFFRDQTFHRIHEPRL